jgi:biotin carboxylase
VSGEPRVVVVGGGPGLCDRLRQAGAEITLVDTPAGHDPALLRIARRVLLTGYDDPALIPALVAIHRDTPFTAVLSLTEQGLLPAARMAQALGIESVPPEVVGRTRDKLAMRDWLRETGFSNVPATVAADAAAVRAFGDKHGYPVIVKPRHGQGSANVACFRGPGDIVMPPPGADDYLAEPYLPGPEYSVEAFSHAGEHHIIAITGKLTQDDDADNPFVEIGHVVPAPLPADAAAAIEAYVSAFLDTMGIAEGCTHTELRLTPAGPRIIETHTRVGGDCIPTLVRQATGHDLLDMLVDWALHRSRPGEPAPGAPGAAAIRYFTLPPGRVTAVHGLQRRQGLPGVLKVHLPLRPGDTIPAVKDSRSRAGYVIAVAPDTDRAVALCRQVITGITIEVE